MPAVQVAAEPRAARLRDLLGREQGFTIAAELVTNRGLSGADHGRAVREHALALAADPRFEVVSITDNPGGNPMLAPEALAGELAALGQEVIIHLACKDANRNALESRAWALGSGGFDNILALSGDYPVTGHDGLAAPVFDIDSVGLLKLLGDMNEGIAGLRHPERRLERTDFFAGCVVTNHKRLEREVMPQYFKLRKKARAGARFVINQIGWNARKDDELLRWIRREKLALRTLANVYLLSRTAARVFHAGRIPGVVVSDELLALVERRAGGADKGRRFFIELAAKHVAVARGLGYDGVYLGGHANAETYREIIDIADSYSGERWQRFAREISFPFDDEFYFFEPDERTGLSSDRPSAAYLEPRRLRRTALRTPLRYRFSRRLHGALFDDHAPLFPAARAFYRALERAPRPLPRAAHGLEQAVKVTLFSCRDCGDCSLPEIAYVCPESICAKNQRNGPCGGTRDGLCEVFDSECIWSQAYERLKAYGDAESMLDNPVVVKDNSLRRTSAWANAFLGRDHRASADG
jgi:methylenetetrahydrofolate reductase (NADPH)